MMKDVVELQTRKAIEKEAVDWLVRFGASVGDRDALAVGAVFR